jgi:hypothetical protein
MNSVFISFELFDVDLLDFPRSDTFDVVFLRISRLKPKLV